MVLNSSFFAESKVRAPTVSNCFPLHFQKKNGIARKVFLQKNGGLTILAWSRRAAPDCFRLLPTVSVSQERQLDLWTTDSTKITTFNTFPDDPSARRLLEIMHFDFETQYTLKIPKTQDLVKFNTMAHSSTWLLPKLHKRKWTPPFFIENRTSRSPSHIFSIFKVPRDQKCNTRPWDHQLTCLMANHPTPLPESFLKIEDYSTKNGTFQNVTYI